MRRAWPRLAVALGFCKVYIGILEGDFKLTLYCTLGFGLKCWHV